MKAHLAESTFKVPPAPDLSRALTEARALADGVGSTLSTTHLLLSFFTVPNPAEVLLKEHLVDEDKILAVLKPTVSEDAHVLTATLEAAEETALRCDARQTNTLHLLAALLKQRDSAAHALLERALGNPAQLRNRVLSFLTGVLPRRLLQPIQDAKLTDDRPAAPLPRVARPLAHARADDWVVPKHTMLDDMSGALAGNGSQVSVVDADDKDAPEADGALSPTPAPEKPTAHAAPPAAQRPADGARPEGKRKNEPALPSALTMPPTAFDLDAERFPWLVSLGKNLTALAANGGLDPAVGREQELEQLIDVLGKRRANNPCLVGEPGVGKTAIVEGLAVRLVRGDPSVASLDGKVLIELDMGRIVAGTSLRGSFSERMQGIKRDVQRAKGQVIVFIDEIHTMMGAGSSGDGPQDAANELKAALARGDFPCIGSTTLDEYKKHIEQDPALERRFVRLLVEEPSDDAAIAILRGAAPLYAAHHHVAASDDAICAAVQLSARFIHDKRLPAKALDLLDLALSRARRAGVAEITREHVARVCADTAKVPLDRVLLEDGKRFLEMESFLAGRVVGHEAVIARVANTIRRNYAGFTTHRPLGSFLFLGPSGVGKTELGKALADFLFGTEKALTRIDMSEYSEPHTVARLLGAPPGYVGHADGGQLTEAVRARPHTVVLLDEIEKAHPDVLPLLLQVLDDGRLTDGKGRTVTFRHALVIMTSNLGTQALQQKGRAVGFSAQNSVVPTTRVREDAVLEAARRHFAPELWGRIEDKLVFAPLGKPELSKIAGLLLDASARALLTTRNITLRFDDGVLAYLVGQSDFEASSGARPMRQVIQRLVEAPVSEAILRGEVPEGARIRLHVDGGRLIARAARGDKRAS